MNSGTVIANRYEIKSKIGKGGMQDVFLAYDSVLESNVALKTPLPGQGNLRFNQSAIIAARINHHNVAKTYDYFEFNGNLFLIEEFVEGENLEDKLTSFGAIDPHLAARIFLHIAKGLAASHHAGVVHRDIKPSNVIVEPGVNLHQLKLTDFGIATLAEEIFEEAAKEGDLTRSTSGTIKGALPYMAPEMMFRQPGEHPGKEADIWSLGAMMFRILTGEVPFGYYLQAAVNVQNRNRTQWPSFMTNNPQFKPLATELQAMVERCLSYEPEHRPTADSLVTEISELCIIGVNRKEGRVKNLIQNGFSGFIDGPQKTTSFFSMESHYGKTKPAENDKICYAEFNGSPRNRAHPVIVIK
ncbi:serine/threonine protein kinase [Alteromonas sp. McT4-15]|uniref:serine/threonine-protein kinase n=1 Tax=Alteromonas sp. McT4-15 TaxID=2881256 RepID=UPI001CF8321A|nr:serine/threonine-protein kinase [Alteromonas sp. McT4-15]MCB4435493.1 serine/threonine protein kinase [Alteromonas sp. McT4-15]